MVFRPDRASKRPVRHFEWRVRLVGSGAILAAFGIAADVEPLRWAAFAVLLVAAALSVTAKRAAREHEEDEAA